MNGFVHGVQFVKGVANYKYILLGWDIVAFAGLVWLGFVLVKGIKEEKVEN